MRSKRARIGSRTDRGASRRPKIAIVAPSLEIVGGQSVQARALRDSLQRDAWEVSFLEVNPTFPKLLRRLRRYPYLRTLVNQILYLPSLAGLRDRDVVHVFSASYWSFLLAPVPSMLAGRLMRKRVILNYHSGEAEDHLSRWSLLVHPWLRLAHEIVVPSEYLRLVFARHGYDVGVIPNVVDLNAFRFRERRPLGPRLLSTRNLHPYYRVDVALLAFASLKKRYPDATLTVAGYGSEEGKLRRLAASLGVEGIRFVGRIEPSAVPALYDEADIFLNGSVLDNQPLSILEAFASGLPVVSTATGDIGAMVRNGETGLVVPPADPAAMADAVVTLLSHPDFARRVARRAREEAESRSWERVRDAWKAVYRGKSEGRKDASVRQSCEAASSTAETEAVLR